jgi:hypothetical protein
LVAPERHKQGRGNEQDGMVRLNTVHNRECIDDDSGSPLSRVLGPVQKVFDDRGNRIKHIGGRDEAGNFAIPRECKERTNHK